MIAKLFIKKQLHRDYLNYLFPVDANGNYDVSRCSDFGKMLTSLVSYSKFPEASKVLTKEGVQNKKPPKGVQVSFLLPASPQLANAGKNFLYYKVEDQERLNDLLEVIFNIDFDSFYLNGRKANRQQKEIIQDFIITRKLLHLIGDNETLKKRQYRDELKIMKNYLETLTRKAYERHGRSKNEKKAAKSLAMSY